MFKPTKKQHVVNKAYADKNGGSGAVEPFIIRFTGESETYEASDRTLNIWFTDAKPGDVAAAFGGGRPVLIDMGGLPSGILYGMYSVVHVVAGQDNAVAAFLTGSGETELIWNVYDNRGDYFWLDQMNLGD